MRLFKTYTIEFNKANKGLSKGSIELLKDNVISEEFIKTINRIAMESNIKMCSCTKCMDIDNISDECEIIIIYKRTFRGVKVSVNIKGLPRDINILINEFIAWRLMVQGINYDNIRTVSTRM